eukprot:COSAG02_NODE_5834_length_4002_cov_6.388932_3_plen_172_part_00
MYYYVKSSYNVNPVCPRAARVQVFRNVQVGGSESGPCDSGTFLLGVRPDRTPSKNVPESHRTREGPPATACSTSTVPGAGSDRRSSVTDFSLFTFTFTFTSIRSDYQYSTGIPYDFELILILILNCSNEPGNCVLRRQRAIRSCGTLALFTFTFTFHFHFHFHFHFSLSVH